MAKPPNQVRKQLWVPPSNLHILIHHKQHHTYVITSFIQQNAYEYDEYHVQVNSFQS